MKRGCGCIRAVLSSRESFYNGFDFGFWKRFEVVIWLGLMVLTGVVY